MDNMTCVGSPTYMAWEARLMVVPEVDWWFFLKQLGTIPVLVGGLEHEFYFPFHIYSYMG